MRKKAGIFIEDGNPAIILSSPLLSKETMSEKEMHVYVELIKVKFLEQLRAQFEKNTLSRTRVFTWHKEFSGARAKWMRLKYWHQILDLYFFLDIEGINNRLIS